MARLRSPDRVALASMVISILALTFSMGVFAGAEPRPGKAGGDDDVELLTIATGSVDVYADALEDGSQVAVPMENDAFTQEAGTSILFLTNVSVEGEPPAGSEEACNGYVAWNTLGDTLYLPDTQFQFFGIWSSRDVFSIGPSDADRSYPAGNMAVAADAVCIGDGGTIPTFTVEVEVAVLALR